MRAIYPILALWFVAAQVPAGYAVGCPSQGGVALRACCCEQPVDPVPASSCCGAEAEESPHAECTCALAPAAESDTAIQSPPASISRAKVPTALQPNEVPNSLLMDLDDTPPVGVLHLPQGRDAPTFGAAADTPAYILLCAILR